MDDSADALLFLLPFYRHQEELIMPEVKISKHIKAPAHHVWISYLTSSEVRNGS